MTQTFYNGQSGTVSFSSTAMDVTSWTGTWSAEALDTTNTGSSGHMASQVSGPDDFSVEFEGFYDSTSQPNATFAVGTAAAFVLTIGGSTKTISFTGRIESLAITNEAKSVVTYTGSAKLASGAITYS